MASVTDFIKGVVSDVLADLLKKTTGTGKRVRRRKRAASATERLEKIEKLVRPARKAAAPANKQTSRKRTSGHVRSPSVGRPEFPLSSLC